MKRIISLSPFLAALLFGEHQFLIKLNSIFFLLFSWVWVCVCGAKVIFHLSIVTHCPPSFTKTNHCPNGHCNRFELKFRLAAACLSARRRHCICEFMWRDDVEIFCFLFYNTNATKSQSHCERAPKLARTEVCMREYLYYTIRRRDQIMCVSVSVFNTFFLYPFQYTLHVHIGIHSCRCIAVRARLQH